jgi:hypothetical protein
MFLASLAQRYGHHPSLLYYQFKVSLGSFGRNETISDTLIKFCYPGRFLVICVEEADDGRMFKTVRN